MADLPGTREVREICRQFLQKLADGVDEYIDVGHGLDVRVRDALAAFPGVKTDVRSDLGHDSLSRLRVSVVMSDFTSVFLDGPELQCAFNIKMARAPKHVNWNRVEVSEKLATAVADGIAQLFVGHLGRADDEAKRFIDDVEPLIDAGRLLVRPQTLALLTTRERPLSKESMKVIELDPNQPGSIWLARGADDDGRQDSVPLEGDREYGPSEKEVARFLLPFIEGLSFRDLAALLADEQDSLASFRLSVKEMIANSTKGDPPTQADYFNDVVRPKVEIIERRFRSLVSTHSARCAGLAVSSAALALLVSNAGIGQGPQLVGAGGLAAAWATEASAILSDKHALKELPLYLLWRCSRYRRE